jgi:hypothetical protein
MVHMPPLSKTIMHGGKRTFSKVRLSQNLPDDKALGFADGSARVNLYQVAHRALAFLIMCLIFLSMPNTLLV